MKGENHPQSKLSSADIRNIRALVDIRNEHRRKAAELTNEKIAEKFDIHEGHVRRIASGKNWSHL